MKRLIFAAFLFSALAFAGGETISPNMSLVVPGVGVTSGPQWASDLNISLGIIDAHNHTPGNGVPIPPAGLDINSPLTFQNNQATNLQASVFSVQSVAPSCLGCFFVEGVDAYYIDGNGNVIQLTANGSPRSSTGNIQGLPSTPVGSASITWQNSQGTFQFTQDSGAPGANADIGSLILRYPGSYPAPAGQYIALEVPTSLSGGSYVLTLPASLPTIASALIMSTSGVVTASGGVVPTGMIAPYGGTSAPTTWLLCDGTSYLRATYPALFSAIGTAYGAADGTHFNVPDFRGQFLRGLTGASANDPDASSRTAMNTGGNTGNNVGSIQNFATAPSGLVVTAHGQGTLTGYAYPSLGSGPTYAIDFGATSLPITGANETRPINAYVNYIIKY